MNFKNLFLIFIYFLIFYLLFKKTVKYMKETRGIKNNNPFNIKKNINKPIWKGEIFPSTDKVFSQFTNMEYGIRAGLLLLKNNYLNRTLEQAINKYAPPIENPTNNYIEFVEKISGIKRNEILNINHLIDLAYSILYFENGFKVFDKDYLFNIAKKFNIL